MQPTRAAAKAFTYWAKSAISAVPSHVFCKLRASKWSIKPGSSATTVVYFDVALTFAPIVS